MTKTTKQKTEKGTNTALYMFLTAAKLAKNKTIKTFVEFKTFFDYFKQRNIKAK